jgi:hypothetical protein
MVSMTETLYIFLFWQIFASARFVRPSTVQFWFPATSDSFPELKLILKYWRWDLWMTFLHRVWRDNQITNLNKPRTVGDELLHADGETSRLKSTQHIFYKYFLRQSLTSWPLRQQAHVFIQDLKLSQRYCWPMFGGCDDAVSTDTRTSRCFRRILLVVIFRVVQSILVTVLEPEDEGIFILVKNGNTL